MEHHLHERARVWLLLDFQVQLDHTLEDDKCLDERGALLFDLIVEAPLNLRFRLFVFLLPLFLVLNEVLLLLFGRPECDPVLFHQDVPEELELVLLVRKHLLDRLNLLVWQALGVDFVGVKLRLIGVIKPLFGVDEAALSQQLLEVKLHVAVIRHARPGNQAHMINHEAEGEIFDAEFLKKLLFSDNLGFDYVGVFTEEEQVLVQVFQRSLLLNSHPEIKEMCFIFIGNLTDGVDLDGLRLGLLGWERFVIFLMRFFPLLFSCLVFFCLFADAVFVDQFRESII